MNNDAYTFDGADYSAQTLEAIEVGAGLRLTTSIETGSGVILPEATLMAWHDFGADAVQSNVEFDISGESFTYFGRQAIKNRYQAGVGVEYWMDNNVTLTANYNHDWQSGFKANTWVLKARYDF